MRVFFKTPRWLPSGRCESGQVTALTAVLVAVLSIAMTSTFDLTMVVGQGIATQNAADAAALATTTWQARGLNTVTYVNYLVGGLLVVYAIEVYLTAGAALLEFPPWYLKGAWMVQDGVRDWFPLVGVATAFAAARANHVSFGAGFPDADSKLSKYSPLPLHASRYNEETNSAGESSDGDYEKATEVANTARKHPGIDGHNEIESVDGKSKSSGLTFTRKLDVASIEVARLPDDLVRDPDLFSVGGVRDYRKENDEWGYYCGSDSGNFVLEGKLTERILDRVREKAFERLPDFKTPEGIPEDIGKFLEEAKKRLRDKVVGKQTLRFRRPVRVASVRGPEFEREMGEDPFKADVKLTTTLTLDLSADLGTDVEMQKYTYLRCDWERAVRRHRRNGSSYVVYEPEDHTFNLSPPYRRRLGETPHSVQDGLPEGRYRCPNSHPRSRISRRSHEPYYDAFIKLGVHVIMTFNIKFKFGLFYKKLGGPQERAWGYAQTPRFQNSLLGLSDATELPAFQGLAQSICYLSAEREKKVSFLMFDPSWNCGLERFSDTAFDEGFKHLVGTLNDIIPVQIEGLSEILDELSGKVLDRFVKGRDKVIH